MGFLPDIRRVLKHVPAKRQTLFFSATMPTEIARLAREMLSDPTSVNLERKSMPATGITQAVYPVAEDLKPALFLELLKRREVGSAIVFCRTKHRANRLAEILDSAGVPSAKIHGNRSQTARTDALAGFKSGKYRVLVATDIVARGIDVEALEHVVNFDVPAQPEDYIHRVGRTARADATGDAYTLYSPQEEKDLRDIERAIGKSLPRRIVEGFDYRARPTERFEVPIAVRIAEIRRRKAEDRERAKQKAELKAQRQLQESARSGGGRSNGGRAPQPQGERREGAAGPRRETASAGARGSNRGRRSGGRS
jgi:ATP-dependent RNA helicase RhlE